MLTKVFPAIRAQWPGGPPGHRIWVQQDNAPSHAKPAALAEAGSAGGWDIALCNQPAQSPDLNVFDLAFFRSIDALAQEEDVHTVPQLVALVERSFRALDLETLDNVFLTLQCCMAEVLKDRGGNGYKIPHVGKARLRARGLMPVSMPVDRGVFEAVKEYMHEEVPIGHMWTR
jgi:hypothetical protein